MVLHTPIFRSIIALVFHRILDFKTGLNFYSGPFFFACNSAKEELKKLPLDYPVAPPQKPKVLIEHG
jgi:hypothetical protein